MTREWCGWSDHYFIPEIHGKGEPVWLDDELVLVCPVHIDAALKEEREQREAREARR